MTRCSPDIILYGGPGAGKGTQAKILSKKLGAAHLDMGREVRKFARGKGTDARQVKSLIDAGKLISVRFTKAIAGQFIAGVTGGQRIVFDGYPRHLIQKQNLGALLREAGRDAKMVYIKLPDNVAHQRLTRRANIEHRLDDINPQAISSRIRIFHRNAAKLIDSYRRDKKLIVVDGNQPVGKVAQTISQRI